MSYGICYDLNKDQLKQLHKLFQKNWWSRRRTLREIKILLEHTDIMIGVVDEHTADLLGFCRILTDYASKAVVMDVLFHPDCSDEGVRHCLMDAIFRHEDLTAVEQFEMCCSSNLLTFYDQAGVMAEAEGLSFRRANMTTALSRTNI